MTSLKLVTPRFDGLLDHGLIRNIYALGRNYAEHARELGNEVSAKPLIFMKPRSSIIPDGSTMRVPRAGRPCHHEVELAVLIGAHARFIKPEQSRSVIAGYAIALDMTLRGFQDELKKAGKPWEPAKAWEGSLPLSPIHLAGAIKDPNDLRLECRVDGQLRQNGTTRDMILKVDEAVAYLSELFVLRPGDLLLTGTPAGVGAVEAGQVIEASITGLGSLRIEVADEDAP
jgi:2-keto-4-pentenoate hydratase/2-oxohepta-3-ene-1,7-dioic acid hydratase in catechol pathway